MERKYLSPDAALPVVIVPERIAKSDAVVKGTAEAAASK